MIHSLTLVGSSAKNFYLEEHCISDFKSLMRAITSGRGMIISTKFRSDFFYNAEKPEDQTILKLWALYADTEHEIENNANVTTRSGDVDVLSGYFLEMNNLSANWYEFRQYQSAFIRSYISDSENPVANMVMQCDCYLTRHPKIKRPQLLESIENTNIAGAEDTFSLAMGFINRELVNN